MMGKVFALFFIFLLAALSMTGYLILTQKISVETHQLAEGERQIEKGQKMLTEGKAKLESGKRKLSQARKTYRNVEKIPFMKLIDKLPITGGILADATNKIAKGAWKISKGEANVKIGEGRLKAGKRELYQGKERLSKIENMRIACAFGTVFFVFLLIVLSFYWRYAH